MPVLLEAAVQLEREERLRELGLSVSWEPRAAAVAAEGSALAALREVPLGLVVTGEGSRGFIAHVFVALDRVACAAVVLHDSGLAAHDSCQRQGRQQQLRQEEVR